MRKQEIEEGLGELADVAERDHEVQMARLPWTQNITGKGYVTTLEPDKRPQTIQSQIPGRIEEWFVREGDFVQKGDTMQCQTNQSSSKETGPSSLQGLRW